MTDTDGAATKPVGQWPPTLRWEWVLLSVVLLVSIVWRIPTLDQNLVEAHGFRQTQTAMQTVQFHESGIDLLRPEIPVLGEPWTIPFEFPLFQAVASVPMAFGASAEVANRSVGLLFFALSAAALWALMRLMSSRAAAAVAVVVFSFSPFGFLWSRSSMIEYLATAGVIVWVIGTVRWIATRDWRWAAVGAAAGVIAALVKSTTAFAWVAPIILLAPKQLDSPGLVGWLKRRLEPVWLALIAIPGLAALAWTWHADSVKSAAETTAWLASAALRTHNFGTLEQRLSGDNLDVILERIDQLIVGRGWLVLILIATVAAGRNRAFWVGLLLVPAVAIGLFFNLYLAHDYYLAAITPALAALLGMAIVQAAGWLRMPPAGTIAGLTLLWMLPTLAFTQDYWNKSFDEVSPPDQALAIAQLVDPDDRVIVAGNDWNPKTLFYAERRGLMIKEPHITADMARNLPDIDRYTLLWVEDPADSNVDFAATRPWFAPVSANAIRLGGSRDALGDVPTVGSTSSVLPAGERSDLGGRVLACGGTDSITIPSAAETWLSIDTGGNAYPRLDSDLAILPSSSALIGWRASAGKLQHQPAELTCTGGDSITIIEAVVVP